MDQKSNASTRISYIFLILLVFGLISAAVAYPVQFILTSNSVFTTTTINCADTSCSSYVDSTRQNINSGTSTNQYSITGSDTVTYMELDTASCQLPQMYRLQITPSTTNGPYTVPRNFTQKANCGSNVNSVQLSNSNPNEKSPITVTVNVQAAISYPKDSQGNRFDFSMVQIPSDLSDFYSSQTQVVLRIKDAQGNVVHTETKIANPLINKSESLSFDYTPQSDGSYTAEVETQVTDCMCTSTQSLTGQTSLSVQDTDPVAGFSFSTVIEGQEAQFTDTSTTNDGVTWEWNFGDGTALDTRQNPLHTFSKGGAHQVTLTLREVDGDSSQKSQIVDVQQVNDNPTITANINNVVRDEDFGSYEVIDLTTLESDEEDGPASDTNSLRWSVASVSDPSLVDVSIDVNTEKLTLISKQDKFGTATITLKLSDSQSSEVTTSFSVQVDAKPETQGSTTTNTQLSSDTVFTNSQGTNSNIQSSTITDSAVSDSTITNSQVSQNSVVEDSTVSDSNIQNSFIDPSTITRSTVLSSRVINSTITDSFVLRSNITNMDVQNANVTDNFLNSGTIIFSGQTYTGPKSLAEIQNKDPVSTQTVTQISWNEDASDSTLNLNTQFSDPDGDSLAFSSFFFVPNVQVLISNSQVTFVPDADFNGQRNATFRATDSFGKFTDITVTLSVVAQNDNPAIVNSPSTTSATQDQLYTYDADGFDVDGDSLTFSLTTAPTGMTINPSTGLVSWTPTNSQIGDNSVVVQVSDGNSGTNIKSFTISVANVNDAPTISLSQPNGGELLNGVQEIKWSASDIDSGDILTVSLFYSTDGSTWNQITSGLSNTGSFNWNTTGLDGSTFKINATVFDGTISVSDFSDSVFSVDNTPPQIVFNSPQAGTYNTAQTVNVTATDAHLSSIVLKNNGVQITSSTTGQLLQTLTDGNYTLQATATDTLSQLSLSNTISVFIDTVVPSVSIASLSPVLAEFGVDTVRINFTTSDLNLKTSVLNVTYPNGTLLGQFSSNVELTPQQLNAVGVYTATLFADDIAGNTNTTTQTFTVSDSLAPIISNVLVSPSSIQESGSIQINATVSDFSSISYVNATLNSVQIPLSLSGSVYTVSTTAPLNPGTYQINITASDSNGHVSTSQTILTVLDTTNPTIENPVGDTIEFKTEDAFLQVNATDFSGIDKVFANISSVGLVEMQREGSTNMYNVSISTNNFLSTGTYNVAFLANDTFGNLNNSVQTTIFVNDTTKPFVQFLSPTPVNGLLTNQNQTIKISATDHSLSSVGFSADVVGGSSIASSSSTSSGETTKEHSVVLSDGNYTYRGTATDGSGNTNQTEDRTLFIDTIVPIIQFEDPTPSHLSITKDNKTINVSASDANLVSIEIFVDGVSKIICNSNSCIYSLDVSQLTDGAHVFNATTIDVVGNQKSTETRTLVVDKTSPSIQFVSPTPADFSDASDTKIINVTASDLSAFNIIIYIDGQNVTSCQASLCSFEWNTSSFSDGVHSINATSTDMVGNQNSTETRTIQVDNTAPTVSLFSPQNNSLSNSQTQNFVFAANDNIFTSVSCELYINSNLSGSNNSVSSGVNTTITNTSVPEGTNTWYVQCADVLGNSNVSETRTLKTDYTAPEISTYLTSGWFPLIGVVGGGFFSPQKVDGQYDSISMTVNTTEDVVFGSQAIQIINSTGQVVNSFDGPGETSKSISKTWFGNDSSGSLLPDGDYIINATFTDLAGNSKTKSLQDELSFGPDLFIVDNTAPSVDLGQNRIVNEGALQTFDGTNSTDTGSEINTSSFVWDFGDGQTATGQTANHTYSQNGTYTARLNVTDKVGNVGSNTITATVLDLAPTATIVGDNPIFEGNSADFNSLGSTSSPDAISKYEWDFDFNGVFNVDSDSGLTPIESSLFNANGTYIVAVRVTDADGSTNVANMTLTVLDKGPIAQAGLDQTVNEGSVAFFNGSNSTSSPDSISSYFWEFGDNSNSTGQTANHTYTQNGTYTTNLTVTDSDGSTNSDTLQVTVNDLGPAANFDWSPEPQYEDLPVQFNDTSTFVVDAITSRLWDFGDGSTSNETNPVHTYGNQNVTTIFLVILTITDSDGSINSTTKNITINPVNDPPVVSTIPNIVFNEDGFNDSLVLSNFVSDIDNLVSEINWSNSPTQNLTVSIDNSTKRLNVSALANWFGNETIVLTATDGQNQTQSNQIIVIVNSVNDAPVVSTTALTSATEDSLYSYDVNATDVDLDVLSFSLANSPIGMTINNSTGAISWTPNNTQVGQNNVSVQVSDGNGGTATQDFVITVANNVPSISNPGIQSATEDSSFSVDVNSTDENEDLVFSLVNPPTGMTINETTGLISWTPLNNQVGTNTINVSVDDTHGGTDSKTFDISVTNNPTTISTSALTSATEDSVYTYDVNSTDEGQGDVFSLTTSPTGMTINNSTGAISWTPLNNQVGSNNVQVEVDDGKGGSDTQAFSIAVSNNPPLITTTALTSATEDLVYTYDVNSTDEDQGLVYNLTTSPTGMTINQTTGLIQWTPINSQVGINSVVVLANDTKGGTATQSYSLIVSNNAPVFTTNATTTATEDTEYIYDANSTDEGDGATFSLTTSPSGMTINSTTGLVNWTALNNQVGSNSVNIRVNDGKGGQKSQSFSILVSNNPPSITTSAVLNATEDSSYSYDVNSSDDDQGTISYSLVLNPSGMSIDSSTGLISWTPLNNQVGSNNVSVQVFDGNNGIGEQNFTVAVANVNPTILTSSSLSATENIEYTYDVNSSDDDQGTISYSLLSSPLGMSVNGLTGLIQWIPINTQFGSNNVSVQVSDGNSGTDVQNFTVVVTNSNPTINSSAVLLATEDSLYSYDVNSDEDGEGSISYSLVLLPVGMSINSSTGLISWTPDNTQVTENNVSVQVSDGNGGVGEQNFTINVSNNPPIISDPGIQSTTEDSAFSVDVNSTDEGQGLLFYLENPPTGMTIDAPTGLINWTPLNNQVGLNTVNVSVNDWRGGLTSLTFDINVGNNPTTISTSALTSATEDSVYTYDVNSTDEGQGDVFSLTTSPTGMTINNSTGAISWTPLNNQVGSNNVQVEVDDGKGGSDTQTFSISVVNTNDVPVLSAVSEQNTTEDVPYQFNVTASDDDLIHGDNLTYSVNDTRFTITKLNNTLASADFTPTNADVGSFSIQVNVTDTQNSTDTKTFLVNVANVNDAPVFNSSTPLVNVTFNEDDSATLALSQSFFDIDVGTTLNYLASSVQNISVSINQITGVASFVPEQNFFGTRTVTFKANDGIENSTDSNIVTITVNPVNDAPVVSNIPNITMDEDVPYVLNLSQFVSDVDNTVDEINWTGPSTFPLLLEFDNQNKTLTVTNALNEFESGQFTLTASDNQNETVSNLVGVIVNPVNDAPIVNVSVPDVSFNEDESNNSLDLSNFFTDVDNTTLIYTSDQVENLTVNIIGSQVNISADPNFNGQRNVTFTASDGQYNVSDIISITVNPVNDAPTVSVLQPNGGEIWNQYQNITWSASDVENDVLTVSIFASNNSGSTWDQITTGESNDGVYLWNTTNVSDGNYLVNVTVSDGSLSASDVSDASLTVDNTAPDVSVALTGHNNFVIAPDNTESAYNTLNMDFTANELVTWGTLGNKGIKIINSLGDVDEEFFSASLSLNLTREIDSLSFLSDGTYEINVTVKDQAGNQNTKTVGNFSVDNTPPSVNIASDSTTINEGGSIFFNGSLTNDTIAGVNSSSFVWDFGDGQTTTGQTANHTYSQNGTYTARLNVTDKVGNVGSNTITVTVNDLSPTSNFTFLPSTNIFENTTSVQFNSTTSTGYDQPLTFSWNFGDGSAISNETNPVHIFANNNTYTVNLTVTDLDGSQNTLSQNVFVNDTGPASSISGSISTFVASTASYSGSGSTGSDQPFTYEWDFNYTGSFDSEQSTGTTSSVNHVFNSTGTFTVAVRVIDADGSQNTSSMTTTVQPEQTHDVAVNSVTYNKADSTVYIGDQVTVSANLSNVGNFDENVSIRLYNGGTIQVVNISIAKGETKTVNLSWTPSAVSGGTTLYVEALQVSGETELGNNLATVAGSPIPVRSVVQNVNLSFISGINYPKPNTVGNETSSSFYTWVQIENRNGFTLKDLPLTLNTTLSLKTDGGGLTSKRKTYSTLTSDTPIWELISVPGTYNISLFVGNPGDRVEISRVVTVV